MPFKFHLIDGMKSRMHPLLITYLQSLARGIQLEGALAHVSRAIGSWSHANDTGVISV